ncbi:MAG: ATP-dependent DNA helicase [Solirubrobacteraceae bacterium]
MANPLDGVTDAQREALSGRSAPLLIDGVPGAGKTEVLAARFCWLVEGGLEAHRPLLIVRDERAAEAAVRRIEALLDRAHEALSVHTMAGFCASLLAEHAAAAGIEEPPPVLTAGERLALLLESAVQLELRHHDFRGRPLTLFAAFVRRIDQLKAQLIDAERFTRTAADGSERDREFAAVYLAHDRLLRERGALDAGDRLIACVRMLEREPALSEELGRRHEQLLVDDWQTRGVGERELVRALVAGGISLTVAGDDHEARLRDGDGALERLAADHPSAVIVRLEESLRCPPSVISAALALADDAVLNRSPAVALGAAEGPVRFWRCATVRAQAQHVAAELERLLHSGVAPERCVVLLRSVAADATAVIEALDERGVEHRLLGPGAFFERTEVRDVLAWLRLLVDPRDAAAVVRALARPPIELNAVDIARCVQLARRRKLDLVAGLGAALESSQLPPEARERVANFLQIQRASAAALDEERADLFVHRLIERLGLRRHQLFSARADVAERLVNLAQLSELAARHARAVPGATPREFAAYAAAVAESGIGEDEIISAVHPPAVLIAGPGDVGGQAFDHVFVLSAGQSMTPRAVYVAMTRAHLGLVFAYVPAGAAGGTGVGPAPAPFELVRAALGGSWEEHDEELFGPSEALHALFGERREELLDSVARVGARLGELRFDTDLDVTHAVVRLLELIKLAALLERRDPTRAAEQSVKDALADVNARLSAAATPLEREILLSSPLDDLLLGGDEHPRRSALWPAAREEPSLAAFLPRRGDGLVLSASDVDTYRACPLRYKFARVLRIPREPTLNQRFGILVHQVLERFHGGGGGSSEEIARLLEASWRRGGFGDSDEERQLHEKARVALARYHERLGSPDAQPRWFERSFNFALGRNHIRGRVDRIDALPGGGYELIDYKTGVPRRAEQLRDDVQLALYALAAREAWQIEATERTYYYVLDDERVRLGVEDGTPRWIEETVEEVAGGILAQAFEPTPSFAVCSMCEYRIACPAAEK